MATHADIDARLGWFVRAGRLERLPSPWQLRIGTTVMLPITLSESERERSRSRSTFAGQVPIRVPLQLLYSPRQLLSTSGIELRARDIVRHLLCVYHEDAFLGYDLQLLESHDGGLELLESEANQVVEGRNRISSILQRVVGWPGYHAGLVELAARARAGEYPDPLDLDPRFCTLLGFAQFCCSLPDWPDREFYWFERRRRGS
jgi:hypothetical protein